MAGPPILWPCLNRTPWKSTERKYSYVAICCIMRETDEFSEAVGNWKRKWPRLRQFEFKQMVAKIQEESKSWIKGL